jgi:hypothetical protein
VLAPRSSLNAAYLLVRGWIQVDEESVEKVRAITLDFRGKHSEFMLPREQADLYQSAWVFSDACVNGSRFVFYGADIQERASDFILAQLEAIAEIPDIDGFFALNGETDADSYVLWISGGGILRGPPLLSRSE